MTEKLFTGTLNHNQNKSKKNQTTEQDGISLVLSLAITDTETRCILSRLQTTKVLIRVQICSPICAFVVCIWSSARQCIHGLSQSCEVQIFEPCREKTNILHMRKQRRRSALQ